MAATVAAQLGVPRLLAAVGHRRALVLGCLALGVPAALLPLSPAWPALAGVALARGAGFGILTVTGAALVADLVPAAVRGRATGVYGVAVGLPQLALLPGGVAAWHTLGPVPVLLAGAAFPLLALPALALLPSRVSGPAAAADPGAPPGEPGRHGGAVAPWVVMVVSAASAGGVLTVLPLTRSGTLAGVALLGLTAAQLAGRALAGEVADRWVRAGRLTPVALAVVAAGGAAIALGVGPRPGDALVVTGATLVGLGFGAVQTDTLLALFARSGSGNTGRASSVWNTAYDSGTGLGATGLAAVLGAAGPAAAFGVAGVAGVVVLPVALALRRGVRPPRAPGAPPAPGGEPPRGPRRASRRGGGAGAGRAGRR